MRHWLRDDELTDKILDDFESAGLDTRRLAILRYAVKLTRSPESVRESDVRGLQNAGLSDDDVLHCVQVISYFNFINRMADGLGVELE